MLDLASSFPAVAVAVSVAVATLMYMVVSRFVDKEYRKACCGSETRKSPLYRYDEVVPYLRGNPYITDGYRMHYSAREAMRSLFSIHNETANIWSHGLAWLLFCFFTARSAWDLVVAEAEADLMHRVTVLIYCAGAMSLLACSTTFHWVGCVSVEVYKLTAKLDYTGIAILILVSFFPFILFYCSLAWGYFYSLLITLLTGLAIYVSWSDNFNKPGYHFLRAGLFIGIGLFGGIPLPHACLKLGIDKSWPVLWPLMVMGVLYIGGALIYALRVPERWFNGELNYFGHSHFLFHMAVVAASMVHLWNVHRLIEWRAVAIPHC